jgi:hypothetical protein
VNGYVSKKRESSGPMAPGLTHPLAHRIEQQIKRVYRRAYNAETGLRTLVRLAVPAMVQGGATPQQIRDALVKRIEDQAGAGKDSIITGGSHASDLSKRVIDWCNEAHAELSVGAVSRAAGAR